MTSALCSTWTDMYYTCTSTSELLVTTCSMKAIQTHYENKWREVFLRSKRLQKTDG